MNKYEESAKRIMERGDIILEKKKKRLIKIRTTAGTITGLCAVFAIGFGIWNNTFLKESARPPKSDNSSIIVPMTEESTGGNTSYPESDAQSSSENKKIETTVSTKKITSEKTTSAVSVTPSASQTLPMTPATTAGNTVHTGQTAVTAAVSTAPADTAVTSLKTTVITKQTTVSGVGTTASQKPAATTEQFGDGGAAPKTTAVSARPVQTTTATGRNNPTATAPGSDGSTQPTEPPEPPHAGGGIMPPPKEFVFGDNNTKYIFSGDDVTEENVGEYLGMLSEGIYVYSIVNVPPEEAVILCFYEDYFLYYKE